MNFSSAGGLGRVRSTVPLLSPGIKVAFIQPELTLTIYLVKLRLDGYLSTSSSQTKYGLTKLRSFVGFSSVSLTTSWPKSQSRNPGSAQISGELAKGLLLPCCPCFSLPFSHSSMWKICAFSVLNSIILVVRGLCNFSYMSSMSRISAFCRILPNKAPKTAQSSTACAAPCALTAKLAHS